jgi:hypothetical protein
MMAVMRERLIKEVAESFCIDLSDFGFWELMVGVGGYLCRGIDGCFYEISRDYDFIRYLSRDPHRAVNLILTKTPHDLVRALTTDFCVGISRLPAATVTKHGRGGRL